MLHFLMTFKFIQKLEDRPVLNTKQSFVLFLNEIYSSVVFEHRLLYVCMT